ncbi:MAG: gamma-glutamyltransferase, partial [Bacteroidota bacterium]|nr:gamma-glutamyltransferase [Bacteroidota bacterium]
MQYNFKKSFFHIILFSFLFTFSCENKKSYYNGMVSSAHPIASKIGLDILKSGGNAFDAAIAVHFTLAVVYPQAGNLGGGGFVVYRLDDGEHGSLDFREKAPSMATRDMYLKESGGDMVVNDNKSRLGHLASGVPGSVDGMVKLYEKFATKDWDDLINPAINLAENGFKVTKKQSSGLNNVKSSLEKVNDKLIPFLKDSEWKEGDILIQKDLSKTLKRIKNKKGDGFYLGETADLIVAEMNSGNGIITHEDLENYSSIWRDPIIGYFKDHKIISMGPPSSGGIALLQMLHGAEQLKTNELVHNSVEYINVLSEIESRVYADRASYLGDADFYGVPIDFLLNENYLSNRYKNIKENIKTPSSDIKSGEIYINESDETTHYSIVDKLGNAVSVTTTINSSFGSKVVVDGAGFLLNNEMDDFSIKPGFPNMFGLIGGEANAIEPNKRMLSSMTPTIVEKDKKLFMVLGTPGGSTIITSVFQTILNVIDHKMGMQEAVDAKKFHHQWLPDVIVIEKNSISKESLEKIKKIGHKIMERGSIG